LTDAEDGDEKIILPGSAGLHVFGFSVRVSQMRLAKVRIGILLA
jgi:hypothetical protein